MIDLHSVRDSIHRLRQRPWEELTRWQRAARYGIDLVWHCAKEMQHDRAAQMAAALTYHTLFSLLPMLVLAMVAANAFIGEDNRELLKQRIVEYAVDVLRDDEPAFLPILIPPAPDADTDAAPAADAPPPDANGEPDAPDTHDPQQAPAPLDDEAAPPPHEPPPDQAPNADAADADAPPPAAADPIAPDTGPDANGAPEMLAHEVRRQEFERVRERLEEQVEGSLDALEQIDMGGIGVFGVLIFIYGATMLFVTIEQSFNLVYGTSAGRPWYVRLPLYYTLITLGPVALVGGQVAQERLFTMLEVGDWTNWLVGPVGWLTPFVAAWLVLFLLYVLMPNAPVHKRAAAAGSLVAAVAWVLSKDLFRLYVEHGVLGSFYGALALVPLFLLWLWVTWLIVLFGLELTYTLQAMRGRKYEQLKHALHQQPEDTLIDPATLIPLATQLAQAFQNGRTMSLSELSQATSLPPRVTRRMMQGLEEHRVALRAADALGESYTLARPSDRIRIDEVLAAGEALLPEHVRQTRTAARRAWHFVDQLHNATHRIAEQQTLASLLQNDAHPGDKQ